MVKGDNRIQVRMRLHSQPQMKTLSMNQSKDWFMDPMRK